MAGATVDQENVREENRRIRYLRFLVDLSIASILQGDVSLERALRMLEEARQATCNFFPGKGETFDLIYRPRFLRAIGEQFGVIPPERPSPGQPDP